MQPKSGKDMYATYAYPLNRDLIVITHSMRRIRTMRKMEVNPILFENGKNIRTALITVSIWSKFGKYLKVSFFYSKTLTIRKQIL